MHVTVSYSTRHGPAKQKARGGLNPSKMFSSDFLLELCIRAVQAEDFQGETSAVLVRLREVLHNERTVSSFLIILALHR